MNELSADTIPLVGIGSSILGLVTTGTYKNPLAIYREYIQNAVDALAGLPISHRGRIEVLLDPENLTVRIRDNGPGLSYSQCLRQLLPIGRSSKRKGTDRGFRGIGRLSGLAFASTVTFRTRHQSAAPVTCVTWTGIGSTRNTKSPNSNDDTLDHCVTTTTDSGDAYPAHFFEAEIRGITRYAASTLLNENAVRSYISEVCPVPMSQAFPFTQQVTNLFECRHPLISQPIIVNCNAEPLQRQYGPAIEFSDNKTDHYQQFEELHIPNLDDTGDAALAWVAHSSYHGTIPKEALIRGIRARAGNIQIGNEDVFSHLFQEDRFNRWCVGEVHILDPRIVPNGCRDYFEPSPHLRNLENHLRPFFRRLSHRCRTSSASRNKEKRLRERLIRLKDAHTLAASGYLAPSAAATLVKEALQQEHEVHERKTRTGIPPAHLAKLNEAKEMLENLVPPEQADVYSAMAATKIEAYQQVFEELVNATPSVGYALRIIENILLPTRSDT